MFLQHEAQSGKTVLGEPILLFTAVVKALLLCGGA